MSTFALDRYERRTYNLAAPPSAGGGPEADFPLSINGESSTFDTLTQIIAKLRSPDGCPWDRAQTHQSIKNYLLEECYEALQALDEEEPQRLREELGDILLQVLLHSQIAAEAGEFSIDDVIGGLAEKLVRRHPHVFGDESASTAQEVEANWETGKREERGGGSVLDGVPQNMPSLAYSQSIHRRAANAGFDWKEVGGVLEKLGEEVDELRKARSKEEREVEMGDVLATLVNVGRKLDIDMESALRKANQRFYLRFSKMEELCRERGVVLRDLSEQEQEALWQEAKKRVGAEDDKS
ncbi:MAG: nucleoside triphosphate pyrophosphohydrolase [Dehalococcoidia bacterium]